MLSGDIGQDYKEPLATLRILLGDARAALSAFGAAVEDQEALRVSIEQLDTLFLLVVAGEFNAGKSSFINALIGSQVLEYGVTPTTTHVQVLRYGAQLERKHVDDVIDEVSAPIALLRDVHIVDTPGTNAIERHHEAITQKFLPRADIVFFLTSADRPLTESETRFLGQIRDWGKKIVLILNKVDILETEDDLNQITGFITSGVQRVLGFTPELFAISTKTRAGFDKLETYLDTTLDQKERLRLKLLNPLGIATQAIAKSSQQMDGRAALLQGDTETIAAIESALGQTKRDMEQEFKLRLAGVDNVLHQFEQRGNDFFDETIRLGRLLDLRDKAKIKAEFEKRVIADLPKQMEQRIHEIIDWLVAADLKQWEGFRARLLERRGDEAGALAGKLGIGFDYDRSRLLDTIGQAAERTVEDYNREHEANRIADSLESAVRGVALMSASAIGLGVAVGVLATTAAADITGILAAGTLAVAGFLILPHRKQVARKELHEKTGAMRQQLVTTLTGHFEKEIARSGDRVKDALTPYRQFVHTEREKVEQSIARLKPIEAELRKLRHQLEK